MTNDDKALVERELQDGPDMVGFPHRIRAARKARNMSFNDLAKSSGFTKAHVWELENGRCNNPTIRAVWSLSRALCVSPAWLLGIDPDTPPVDQLTLEVAALIERRLSALKGQGHEGEVG